MCLNYSILDNYFRIDPTNANIYTNGPLDYETYQSVILQIKATSGGGIQTSVVTTFVTITITDVNDFTPVVSTPTISVQVVEGMPVATGLCDFTGLVSDADGSAPNNQFAMSISSHVRQQRKLSLLHKTTLFFLAIHSFL
jgi:hypothetical protein